MFCYNKKGLTTPYDKQTTELMYTAPSVHWTLSFYIALCSCRIWLSLSVERDEAGPLEKSLCIPRRETIESC